MKEGWLGIECGGVERVIGERDGEVVFRKAMHHRLFPYLDDGKKGQGVEGEGKGDEGEKTVFVLSGEESGEVFQLDTVFFQNWYGYQDQFVREGKGPSLVQVMSVSSFFLASWLLLYLVRPALLLSAFPAFFLFPRA